MKNKILTLLLIGSTLVSCSKEEIEPKQCWKFSTTLRVTHTWKCKLNDYTSRSTIRSCDLTKTEAKKVAEEIDKKNSYTVKANSDCSITYKSTTTFFAN